MQTSSAWCESWSRYRRPRLDEKTVDVRLQPQTSSVAYLEAIVLGKHHHSPTIDP